MGGYDQGWGWEGMTKGGEREGMTKGVVGGMRDGEDIDRGSTSCRYLIFSPKSLQYWFIGVDMLLQSVHMLC